MKPGVYPGISNEAYHSGPGLSSSNLKKLLISGAHYKQSLARPMEASKEMLLGSLVHSMILEPNKVETEYFVGEFNVRRGKDYEAALKEAGNRTLVCNEEFEKAIAITESFRDQAMDHPDFNGKTQRLLDGDKEFSYYWEDPKTGILCKCRTDNTNPSGIILDVKTTRNAGFDSFQKSIVDYGYHISAAFYLRGLRALGIKAERFSIVAIETEAPYLMQVYQIGPQALEIGNRQVDQALETYANCILDGQWPGYPQKTIEMELPQWALYRFNRE